MLVSSKDMFDDCYGNYAIAAVNVFTLEQILSLFKAGQKADAPFIIQFTPAARSYMPPEIMESALKTAGSLYPKAVYGVHLDHGNEDHAYQAIYSGHYTSVMIDGSHEPFEDNVLLTARVVEKAHRNNVLVEAELGILSGIEDDLDIDKGNYTKPKEVEEFIKRTGCDSLAVAVGTSHGAYKMPGNQGLQFEILKDIQSRVPNFPIVLHGASTIYSEEITRINNSGGQLGKRAKGVNPNELQKSFQYGVCKVNIATDLRILWTRIHREFFLDTPELFDPIIPGKAYMYELENLLIEKFEVLNAAGKGQRLAKNHGASAVQPTNSNL